jgi:hypothetical protein
MKTTPRELTIVVALLFAACKSGESQSPFVRGSTATTAAPAPAKISPAPATATATPAATAPAPSSVDLRETLTALGLTPRAQGPRGTCSVFVTCEALEFALAKARGDSHRMSPEFLNWTSCQITGQPSDGSYFHNALAGFDRYGICTEESMPYQEKYDEKNQPSIEALAEAALCKDLFRSSVAVHWIVPWTPNRFGVTDAQFAEIKSVLARGYPVAAGSGHSRLLVGYRDDAAKPGGGVFMTEDSALARFDEVTYEFVRKDVADVFWVEAIGG